MLKWPSQTGNTCYAAGPGNGLIQGANTTDGFAVQDLGIIVTDNNNESATFGLWTPPPGARARPSAPRARRRPRVATARISDRRAA